MLDVFTITTLGVIFATLEKNKFEIKQLTDLIYCAKRDDNELYITVEEMSNANYFGVAIQVQRGGRIYKEYIGKEYNVANRIYTIAQILKEKSFEVNPKTDLDKNDCRF